MEPPSFSTTGPQIIRAAPGSDASIVLPLPSGSPPFEFEWSRAGAKLDDRFKRSDDTGGVRLTISAARTGDSGYYTLQASNAAGKDSTRVRLEVSSDETPTGEDPPTFLRRLQDLTVKVGTRTRFLVEIVSSTECRVTWYRNERRLLEAERIALVRDGNFWCADISAVSVDDAGRWTCTAENVGGRASCSAHLNVLVPKAYKRPEFVEELRALLTEQGTVSLECKVVGVPTPVLRWFKDSREIKAGDVFALTANAEDPTSLGTYTCEAVNCMGRAYSSSKVHVVGRSSKENSSRPSSGGITPEPPPIFTKELEDHFVRICEPLTLSCHIVVPPWPRSVVWYNKEGKIEPSERYHVLEDGVGGYLLEVPSAEWPDEGEWKCVATSSGGRVGISTCYVSMDVPKNYRKPRFMENLQAILTEEGLVSFECKVVGFPTPLLSWFKDGQELKPGDVYQLTGTNSLGSYCCIARNCMGQASSSAELTVEDIQNQLNEEEKLQLFSRNQAPKFLLGLKSVEAKIDEPFRFTIKVAIPPEPTILWYRDDQPVDESSRCHHGKEERGVFYLDIQNLEFMDQAEWKCVAMNDYGHSVTSCFLKLIIPRHFKKPRFLENLQAILSDEGAVNLECKVIGVPQPVLKWYKDGEELKPGDIHRIISGQDGTCCLGTYTCEAQNCMGIAASSASLLGFEDSMKAKTKKKADEQALQRNLSLSTIHEERTSQMYDTPVGDMTLDEKGEISFSFDGKEVSVSLYETPDLTEEEALQIIEMYADQLSENVTEHNVVELPPLRFVKETSTSGNLLMEAIIIDVSPEYFTSPEEDLRTEADIEDISIAEDNGAPQISLDVEADGEDYLEKTIALLSDEKSDIPKKNYRKKSDSQRSADDYFSLSRDQSLSEEKKDDDTQMLSESDLQSFASARSSGKPKSKSSKPSIEDGQESSDITKTVVLREDLQNQMIETDVSAVKHKKTKCSSQSSRTSSSGSEKSFSKMKEDMADIKTESAVNVEKIDFNKEKVQTAMNGISLSLTEAINEIQILERDIILKSEFMATAATASNSLEMINTLITPLSEIHCITDAIRETVEYSENITSLLNNLPESLQNLKHSLTVINKCIDVESENKTLVTKTCMSIIKKCGQQLHNIIKDINTTVTNECPFVEKIHKSNIDTMATDLVSIINNSLDMVNIEENKKSEKDENVEEITLESKHLHDTQKAIYDLRGSLRSLLFIVEEQDISKASSFPNIKKSEIILNDMSTPIQDLQTALEQIETLSVTESKSDLHKYNTEMIETAMESVLKLRTSFEQLSAEASIMEDKDVLNEVLNAIKCNLKAISIQLDELEVKTGKFDILNNDNKLQALQKMAQILINLENNLPMLKTVSSVKYHMTEFHKSLTKVLENVIESNDAKKYFSLLEICDAVNRMNASIKSIDSNSELSLTSITKTLKMIQRNVSINVFQPELNSTLTSSIANILVCIQEIINKADELSLTENLDDVKHLSISKYDDKKVNVVIENIEKTIATISNVISHETSKDITLKRAIENVYPILVDLKYCIASLNVTSSDKHENLSDIESISFSQSIANSLIELHQTINVLNQVICENADSEDLSQLSTDYAKTILDLCHTLETLQHGVVSQCIDNEANLDTSSSIANIVRNLKSCIHLMIQEQPIIEGTDDMSTLDDISGIKTTADILSGDEFMIATIKENENILFAERQLLPAPGNVLQTLKDYIVILQKSDVLNVLKPVENLEYTSMKSLIIGLDEICPKIESILHPISMESNQEQTCFTNFDKLLEIIPLLQDMQQYLTNISANTIQVKNDVAETNPEKVNFVQENLQNFKSHLNYCIDIIKPAVEVVDNTVDVSTKLVSLRQTCQKLHSSFLELEKPMVSNKEIKPDISRLKETIEPFLKTTMQQNTAQIKWAIENLCDAVVSVQIALNQNANNKPDLLSKDNIFIQFLHDVKKDIVALQQCNFVKLSDLNVLEEDALVEKSEVSKNPTNKADNLIIHLKELVAPLEIIHNQLMDEQKNIQLELLQENFYERIEMVDLELVKGKLNNINETVKKLEQYLSFDDISVNDDDIDMVIKLNNTVNDILGSIEYMKLAESIKTISKPIEVIKNILCRILFAAKDDGKQTLFKENIEKLLQHMDHYIEIIEIVEEVSAVIKLEDLKETANIVRELQQSLININLTSEDNIQKASDGKIMEEQAEIAQRLHKALVSVQVQALGSSRKLVSSADEDIRQQIIQVVSDLQDDLIALANTNVITEENLTTTVFESNIEEQNAKLIFENQDQFKEIAKEEILLETIELTEHNEEDSESKLSQSTYSNTNVQLNSSSQLSEVEKETFSAALILEELKSVEHDESKSEKPATIGEILVENLNEYISENTVAVIRKLSHTLQSENFHNTVEIAKQLWNTILSETATSGKIDLTKSSTKQVELILSLNEAILITYDTTIEESQELENKVGRETLQCFKKVVTNLRSTLQEIINNIKSLPSVSDNDELNERQEETNIAEFVEQIPTGDPSIADSHLTENIRDLNGNITNNNLPKEVTKSLETNKNLLNSESNNCSEDKKESIDTKELYEENKDLTIFSSTIDQNILKFNTEIDKNKRFIDKENLINHLGEYFCEQTVNDLSSLFKVEDIQPSIEIAHQLYDSFSSIESEISHISTKQLKLAVVLEKTVTSLLESTDLETEDIKAGKKELLKTNKVLSNLRNDLKTLIEITLVDTNISVLDLDDLKVHVTREPFKYEIICSNVLGTMSANETISENIDDFKELELPISYVTEIIDDSNYATKTEITSEKDKNSMKEINRITDEQEEKLQLEDFNDNNSIIKLENLLKEVNDMIDISCDENLEVMQNNFDEVQTIIMKMKSDIDGNMDDAINETLEDLECNVRSVQLQIIENSPQALLKEACTNLQALVAHISEINEVKEILKPTTNKDANDELDECSNDAMQTIEIIEKVSCFKNTQHLEHIISSLNQIKDSIKSLRLKFLTNADTLIMGGVEIVQSIDQVEEKIFCLEKDLETAKDVDPITRDHIISAVHCVYGSISNMRGTISSVKKKYMYENYGKPSRYFLTSIKSVKELVKKEKTSTHWKQFSQSLRKVLNHFEDIKFYINFDKTARLPGDAAFTKIILGELVSVLSREVLESVCNLDTEVIENVHDCVKYINRKLNDIEPYTTLEVKEKIPIFKDLSIIILELTKNIIGCMQNEMMIKKDEDKTGSDLIPSQSIPYIENVNGGEEEKNTIINEVVNAKFTQTLPEIIKENDETPQGMSTVDEIISTTLLEEIENASIQQHQVESKFLQSDENQKMLTNMNLENKCIVQTKEISLEEDSCSKSYTNIIEENYTDATNIKETTKIDLPETINEIEVSQENQEKVCDSEYLLVKNNKEQTTDDQSLPEIISNDNNEELGKKIDIKKQTQQQEKKQIENSKICDENEKYVNADNEKNIELSETKEAEENVLKEQQHKKDTVLSIERKVEELVDSSIENENKQDSKPIELRDMYENSGEKGAVANVEEKKEFMKSLEMKENIEINTGIEKHFNIEFEEQEQESKETLMPIESTAEELLDISESSNMPDEKYKPQNIEQAKESKNCDDNEKVFVAKLKEKEESVKVKELKENEESTSGNEFWSKKEFEKQEKQQKQTISTIESTVAESVKPFMENTDMLVEKSKLQAITQVEEVKMCVSYSDEKRNTNEDEENKGETEIKEYYESSSGKGNIKTMEYKEYQEQEHQQKETLLTKERTVKEPINTCGENIDMTTNKSNLQGTTQVEESAIYGDSEYQFTDNVEVKKESLNVTEIKEDKEQLETENKCRVAVSVNSLDKNKDILMEKSILQKTEQVEDIKICSSEKEVIAKVEEKEANIKVSEIKEHEKSSTREGVQFENDLEKQEQKYEETVSNIDSTLGEAVTNSITNTVMPADKCKLQETMQVKDSEICNSSVNQVNVNVVEKEKSTKVLETKEYEESSTANDDKFKKEFKDHELKETVSNTKTTLEEPVETSLKNEDISIPNKSKHQEREPVKESKVCDSREKQVTGNIEEKEKSTEELDKKEYEECNVGKNDQLKKEFKDKEQQEKETVSTIESMLKESVDTSLENKDMLVDKSPRQIEQIKENKICDNSEKQVNVSLDKNEKSISVVETKEYEESTVGKEDQQKDQEQQQKETTSNIESNLEDSINACLKNANMLKDKSILEEMEQDKEKKICDDTEKQVVEIEKSIEVLETKEYEKTCTDKEDKIKKEFRDQEQKSKETASTIEVALNDSIDIHLENKDTLANKSKPQEKEQVKESKICDHTNIQVNANVVEKAESIKVLEPKEYEKNNTGKDCQFNEEDKDQELQQKETNLTSESMVAESVNIFAQIKDVPIDKTITENASENFKEKVTDNLESFDDTTKKKNDEIEVQENKSDFSNVEIIKDLIKDIKTETEITTREVATEEKSSGSQEHYSEHLTGSIKLEIATETQLDDILMKCDTLDLQIQQEEKHYDKVIIEPKQETKLSGKEDDANNIVVSTSVSYNNESIKEPVSQKERTETDIDKLMNEKTKVDLFDKKQEDILLIQYDESTNTSKHTTQQGRIDILNSNQLIQNENNEDVYKAEDDKHAMISQNTSVHHPLKVEGNDNIICSDETLIPEANNNDLLLLSGQDTKTASNDIKKNKEKTLKTQIDNKISIEHINNGQTRKQNNNEKEIKKEVDTKIEEDKLIKEETQDSKTENLTEEKHVGHSDIEEKLKENIGKIRVQTITELAEIEQEISFLNNPIKKEENAEIKIERDPFSDVLSDFSVTESISKITYKSKDDLKSSKNKLEETCDEKIETESKCLELKDNIDRNVAKTSNTKEHSETNFENNTENVKNVENNLDHIINDFNKKTISTTQNLEVLENQDNKKQLMVTTVEKEKENKDNINIDKKQKTNKEDSEGEVYRHREVDNSYISKDEISQSLQRGEENIDEIENLKQSEVAQDSHLLEQVQHVEKVLNNKENSEQLQTIIQENPEGKEESKEQIQEEKKNPEKKLEKQRKRSKKSLNSPKVEVKNEKLEEKPPETNKKNMLDKGKNIDIINLTDPNNAPHCTKADKDDKQNQDNHESTERKEQIKTDVQKNKLELKETEPKFLYEKEVERDLNKNESNDLARQLNETESFETSKNKKQILLIKKEEGDKECKRKEKRKSHDESKINPEEKEIEDKKLEQLKDCDISKQLQNKKSPIIKNIREGQMANEQAEKIMNTIIADNILTDFDSEFSRPPGYIPKAYCVDDSMSQIQITNNKAQTIYKVQTLRPESQLRYSMPPHIGQASDIIEGRLKEKTKAVSECRSTLSEKRNSSSRDVKRKPVFSTFLTDRTAVESSRVKLTCTVLTSTDPKVTWYKNGVQLENKHKFRSKFVDGLITLEILNALPSDSGEYSCSVENKNGSIMSSANLKVYPSFEASPIPPTFTRSIRDTYHLAENELVLECRIRGQPLPTITWLKNDKPILSERYQAHYLADGVCRLTISNPTTEDSGKYTCKAESSVWSDKITHDVYFTGKKCRSSPNIATVEKLNFNRLGLEPRRPHFTNVLSDHKVVTGGTIGLQVEIRGSPTRVEWLREGHSVTESYRNAQTYVDHDIYTLALPDVTEKESGLYTCRAYSNQGNVDMNASITVVQPNQYEGKPATIVSRPEKDVIISVGEDLNISFRVHGEPKAKVFLMKGIRDLTNSQRVCKMTSDDYVKFTLKRTVVSDAGTYCIYARNAYGCDRAFVTVVIRQRASSENLISDWTYPMDDLAISSLDRNYKSVPDRIPSEPSIVHGGNNWVSLAWPKSDHQSRAPILAYKVESWLLGKEGGARWIELGITPRNSFDVFNLKQGEEYHFRVTPRNRYGWGESVQTSVPIGIGLAGNRPEFAEILPGQLKVLVGEKANLRCSFTGKPIPEIVWMKNGHEIEEEPGRVIIEMNNFRTSLRIEEVKIDDEGRYSCEATNVHGRSSTYARMAVITDRQIWEADAKLKRERSAGIDGEYPPQFTMRLRDRRVQATYPVRLTCQVVGNPPPFVKWFKNEEEVIIDGRYTASQDESFYTLEIAPTTLEDGGVYEAMARNGCGAVSCRCNLVVDKGIRAYIAPEFCCGLEPLYRLSEGEELRISAIVEAYPSVGVTWYRDGVRLRPSRRAIMTLDRDGQIELALASVTGRDAGVYTCTASNEVGMASTSGKVEVVSGEYVIEKTSAPPILVCSDMPYSKEPMFIRKPRSSEAREGDTVIIECEVTGDPKPDVYWLRDFLKPDYYRDSSHFKRIGAGPAYRFEIPHAKLDYTGAYSIVAKNIHGETKAIISLQILAKDLSCGDDVHNIKYGRVEVIPRFDKQLTDLLCYDGDAVEFECSVSGNPDPEIRWLHYNENVPECSYFETSYDEGTARLKIKQVTAEDEGTYTCEASNCLGKASSSACLVVYPPGEPNTLSTRLRRPPALLSAASTPRSTPRTTPARSMSRTPGPEPRRLCSPSREIAPKFYTYPFNRVAEEGDTVVFQCAVKGLPPPWATWDKDGIIITPSARITIKEKDEMLRILEIEQVTIEDVGLYRISLENDYGRAEASARLEVITQKGKFYGSTRSYSVSPRKTLPYRRRTPSFSKQD